MSRRLVASYLGITLFVLLVLEVPLGITFARRSEENLLADIERDARVLATDAEPRLENGGGPDPQESVQRYAARTGGRAVVVDATGVAIADSETSLGTGRVFSTRLEVIEALEGRLASGTRASETLGQQLLYVAVPVASGGRVLGAVRVTYPRSALDHRVHQNWVRLGLLGLSVAIATTVIGWLLARSVSRPLRELQGASARVAGGNLRTRVGTDRGPPEVRELAASFNAMSARVEGMLARERAFSADVSHQLRTPLTALRLRLEALELVVPDEDQHDVDAAINEVERLASLIDALLAIARVSEGRIEPIPVDAARVANERIRMWTPLADEREVSLCYSGPNTARALVADGSLDQILDNLLANALDVSPDAGNVTIVVQPDTNLVSVSVRDEGPGMSQEDMEKAFDRFFTTGGTGLGLAIVDRLAQASGGQAFLRRVRDGGLEAGVRLPSA
jgi:signal transduction histidine kinase